MDYLCPNCGKYGIYWDGRAKVLICPWRNCNYIIRIKNYNKTPTVDQIKKALVSNNKKVSRFELIDWD